MRGQTMDRRKPWRFPPRDCIGAEACKPQGKTGESAFMRNATNGSLHAALASRAELMRHHDPERIQGYCTNCEKFGVYWSCPPFAESPLAEFPVWTHVVAICQRMPVAPDSTREQLIERFLEGRVGFGERVRELEDSRDGVTGLVAGHCSGCRDCTRSLGEPCRTPERMRHSLEAVGFDVTGLAEALAGVRLHWPKSGMPEYLTTVGALLCPDVETATELWRLAVAKGVETHERPGSHRPAMP